MLAFLSVRLHKNSSPTDIVRISFCQNCYHSLWVYKGHKTKHSLLLIWDPDILHWPIGSATTKEKQPQHTWVRDQIPVFCGGRDSNLWKMVLKSTNGENERTIDRSIVVGTAPEMWRHVFLCEGGFSWESEINLPWRWIHPAQMISTMVCSICSEAMCILRQHNCMLTMRPVQTPSSVLVSE
jgi:hypothetical protein